MLEKPVICNKKIYVPDYVLRLNTLFRENGGKCYLTGGSVRDGYLDLNPNDYDITCSLPIEKICELMAEEGIEYNDSYLFIDYAIATIDGEDVDITSYYGKDITSKVRHNDFTMNALLYDMDEDCIVDYMDGIKDIENKVLKMCEWDLEYCRGKEILRAIRFALQYDYKIDGNTYKALIDILPYLEKMKPSTLVKLTEKLLRHSRNTLVSRNPEYRAYYDEVELSEEEKKLKKLAEDILTPHIGERPYIQALLNANIKKEGHNTIYLYSIWRQRTEGPDNAGSSFMPGLSYEDFLNALITAEYRDITDEAAEAGVLHKNQHFYSLNIPGKEGILRAHELPDDAVIYAVDGHGTGTLEFGMAGITKPERDTSMLLVGTDDYGNDIFAVTAYPGGFGKESKLERFGIKEGQKFTKKEVYELIGENATIKYISPERIERYEKECE